MNSIARISGLKNVSSTARKLHLAELIKIEKKAEQTNSLRRAKNRFACGEQNRRNKING